MKFAFIHVEKAVFPVAALCRNLGVSRQGYYALATRPVCLEPNVLARDFSAERPNERWVTDISYIWTDEGWC